MLLKPSSNTVMETTGMRNKLGMFMLAASISVLLSGCLVEKKKPEDIVKISRSTETLRIYQPGDFIDYYVTAVTSSGTSEPVFQFGTMRIEWATTGQLTNPIDNLSISPDLKETTTLTYDGSSQPDAIAVRYISQVNTVPVAAPDQGSIILHAIDDQLDADYWPYINGTIPPSSPVITPVVFESPLVIGNSSPQSFSIMECSSNLCDNEIYQFNDDVVDTVGDSTEIGTNLGIFTNPFEISYSGGTIPVDTPALTFLGDIRDACGTSADRITHSGNMFVMPEIGIIKMTNQCQISGGDTVIYTITIRNTSFTF